MIGRIKKEPTRQIRIFKSRWFEKFARMQRITHATLLDAIGRASAGLIDADLGGGLIKQRVARAGQGRSGGFRTIVIFREQDRAIFVFGFAKSDRANLTTDELGVFRKAAGVMLGLTQRELDVEVDAGRLMEVQNGEDIQE